MPKMLEILNIPVYFHSILPNFIVRLPIFHEIIICHLLWSKESVIISFRWNIVSQISVSKYSSVLLQGKSLSQPNSGPLFLLSVLGFLYNEKSFKSLKLEYHQLGLTGKGANLISILYLLLGSFFLIENTNGNLSNLTHIFLNVEQCRVHGS